VTPSSLKSGRAITPWALPLTSKRMAKSFFDKSFFDKSFFD
jgi:hypothetical protein